MLLTAARNSRICRRRPLSTKTLENAAVPSANGIPIASAASGVGVAVSAATAQSGPKMKKTAIPTAKPVAPVIKTSLQPRLALLRIEPPNIA
jgi:hypothetical protein